MLAPIDFDHQPFFVTKEVRYIGSYRHLPTKLNGCKSTRPQCMP